MHLSAAGGLLKHSLAFAAALCVPRPRPDALSGGAPMKRFWTAFVVALAGSAVALLAPSLPVEAAIAFAMGAGFVVGVACCRVLH